MTRFLKYYWLYIVISLSSILGDTTPVLIMRGWLAKIGFKKVGANFQLSSGCKFPYSSGITIGNNVFVANYCWFQGSGDIIIEDEVMIGPFCVLSTNNHTSVQSSPESNKSYRFGSASRKPIIIRRGSWLGSHVVVTAGVEIGKGARIAAGSIITRNVPDGCTMAGVPGRIIT
jgi:maltose O-acetyltransferase